MNVKGQGINNIVELVPDTLKLGPVLPYDNTAVSSFILRNPMEHAIEIYSTDFDKQFIEEEDILKRMENFSATGANELIFMNYRKAGSEFWPSIRKQDELNTKVAALKEQVKKIDEQLAALVHEEAAMAAAALLTPVEKPVEEKKEELRESKEKPGPAKGGKVDPKAPVAPPAPVEPKVRNQEDISNERNALTS